MKFDMPEEAKSHCQKMKKLHRMLVKEADKAAQKATEQKKYVPHAAKHHHRHAKHHHARHGPRHKLARHIKKHTNHIKAHIAKIKKFMGQKPSKKKKKAPHHRLSKAALRARGLKWEDKQNAAAKKWGKVIDQAMKKLSWYHKKLAKRDRQLGIAKKATKAEVEASAEDEKALKIEKNALHNEEKRLSKYRKEAHLAKHEEQGEVRSERKKYLHQRSELHKEAGRLAHYKRAAYSARNVETSERSKLKVLRQELREAKEEDEAYAANNKKLGKLSAALRRATVVEDFEY
jgi:hypothetical protein